jgi:glutamine amidotransferase
MMKETSDGFISMIGGATDTEHLAALYLTYLCSPPDFRGAEKHYNASQMWTALKSAIRTVERI